MKKKLKVRGGAEMVLALRRGRVFVDKKKEINRKKCKKWRQKRDYE